MDLHSVSDQATVESKQHSAILTRKLFLQFNPMLVSHMTLQCYRVTECVGTKSTGIGFLAGVNAQMSFQSMFRAKTLATLAAIVWFEFFVNDINMDFESRFS